MHSTMVHTCSSKIANNVTHVAILVAWTIVRQSRRDPGIGNSTIPNPGIKNSSLGLQSLVVVRSVNGLYGTVHRCTLMHVDLRRHKSPYRPSTCGTRRRRPTAPYTRLTQATQGPKHASNLMHVISSDKFQPCHWPLVEYFAFIALHALRCVLLEIALNASSVVLEGSATSRGAWRQDAAVPPAALTHGMLSHFMVHL